MRGSDITTVGLDLSLTSTGIAVMGEAGLCEIHNIKSKGTAADGPGENYDRIEGIANEFRLWLDRNWLKHGYPKLGVLEAPSHGSRNGKPHERAGLWWAVFGVLHGKGIRVVTVAPATRAKYITGDGRAKKPAVLAAAREMYGQEIPNDDVADASGLAAMGMRSLGLPVETVLSDKQLEAFEGVSWQT